VSAEKFAGGGVEATKKDQKIVKKTKNSTIMPLPEGANGKKTEK